MKITLAKLGKQGATSRSNRPVTICAELAGPNEFMTITVTVMNNGTERDICECGIAKAKDFARQFSDLPLRQFFLGPA